MNIDCGVPQGSVLGPLLFIIYSNDLPKSVKTSNTILFADDTTLFQSGLDRKQLFTDLRNDLALLIDWFRANKLSLNISKTNYVLFKDKSCNTIDDSDGNLQFGSETIERKSHVKFLGLDIDEDLSFKVHANQVISKLSSSLYLMNSVKRYLPLDVRLNLYYSFFLSHISYGILIWGPLITNWHLNRIVLQQKKAVRNVKNVAYNAHTDPIFLELDVLKIDKLIELELLKLMYKVFSNKIAQPISKLFPPSNTWHNYDTRHKNDPQFDQRRHNASISKSFLCKGPTLWTHIDNILKNSLNLKSFTKNVKIYLKQPN